MMILQLRSVPLRGVRILKFGPGVIQTASITGRGTRGGPACLPTPFPYQEKKINPFHFIFDSTMVKMSQENCKLIAVEGPIGVGKSAFCKVLAEQFDMIYIPQPTVDPFFVLPSGYDMRQHDDELPPKLRSYDHKNFCLNPKDVRAATFQFRMLYMRFQAYMDAMCHLLNTGQGVVLERNFYSDYVFVKAMHENKFLSKEVVKAYFEVLKNTSTFFPPPHLIIYLDIPVPVVQERIRTRNYSYEQNSPALTKEYLESLEKYWKKDYLKNAARTSEVLVYNWTDGGDVDVIIDDIEKLDFDITRRDRRFMNWWLPRGALNSLRAQVTNNPHYYDGFFYYPYYLVDELFYSGEELDKLGSLYARIPECQYAEGYNYKMGDSIFKILFKVDTDNHRGFKYHLQHGFLEEQTSR